MASGLPLFPNGTTSKPFATQSRRRTVALKVVVRISVDQHSALHDPVAEIDPTIHERLVFLRSIDAGKLGRTIPLISGELEYSCMLNGTDLTYLFRFRVLKWLLVPF